MSEKLKLTQAAVKNMVPPVAAKQMDVLDAEQPGFGVRIGAKSKTFFVTARVHGRVIRATVGKFPAMNVDDARKKARRMLCDMAEGTNPNDERRETGKKALSLGAVFKSYMATRKNLSVVTVSEYTGRFTLSLSVWETRHVSEITSQMVVDRHISIGTTRGKSSANHTIRLLRAILNFSQSSYGVPKENPCKIMSQARAWYKDEARSNIVKTADMPLFFREVNAMDSHVVRDYLMLLLFTGLRRNEAMGLRWENIDFANEMWTVVRKGGELHSLPLPVYIICLLSERQKNWGKDGYVFPSWSKTGHLTNVQHALRGLSAKGLNFTLHDLRRTFITTAESLDISTYALKRLANHAQTDVTGRHYVIHNVDRLREPMERIAAALVEMGRDKTIPAIPE